MDMSWYSYLKYITITVCFSAYLQIPRIYYYSTVYTVHTVQYSTVQYSTALSTEYSTQYVCTVLYSVHYNTFFIAV